MRVKDAIKAHGVPKEKANELFGDFEYVYAIHFWDCWEVTVSKRHSWRWSLFHKITIIASRKHFKPDSDLVTCDFTTQSHPGSWFTFSREKVQLINSYASGQPYWYYKKRFVINLIIFILLWTTGELLAGPPQKYKLKSPKLNCHSRLPWLFWTLHFANPSKKFYIEN